MLTLKFANLLKFLHVNSVTTSEYCSYKTCTPGLCNIFFNCTGSTLKWFGTEESAILGKISLTTLQMHSAYSPIAVKFFQLVKDNMFQVL